MTMTRSPEPDTTAIRAMIERDNFEFDPHTDGVALLDALDAARAERDAAKGIASRYMDRAEAAEARIAAAHEIHDEHMEWAELNCPCTGCFMARALTGETS